MLKFTKKTEYALIALTHIKGNQDLLISSKDISKYYNIPAELMAKTLQLMARIGYIKAVKTKDKILGNANKVPKAVPTPFPPLNLKYNG